MKKARVLPRAQYAGHVALRTGISSFGMALFMTGVIGLFSFGVVTVCASALWLSVLLSWLVTYQQGAEGVDGFLWLITFGMLLSAALTAGSFALALGGTRLMERVDEAEPLQPLTRHTASSLRPEECLLRAGEVPAEMQSASLLRAVQGTTEQSGRELLRAGQERNE